MQDIVNVLRMFVSGYPLHNKLGFELAYA